METTKKLEISIKFILDFVALSIYIYNIYVYIRNAKLFTKMNSVLIADLTEPSKVKILLKYIIKYE